ncbi:MAG: thioredoxin domain-containing protein [Candidatus Wolfebacteria bacterium]|nr:thioredoxin domain-containing protein [Candidatus Wolfebacteria bacterium]
MEQENKKNDYLLPLSIVMAALLISGSWIYTTGIKNVGDKGTAQAVDALGNKPLAQGEITVNPVSQDDHILGNPDAPVKIIEFSDLECPFCKTFQAAMQQAMKDYSGKVAWIFREYPLDQLHSKARIAAEAAECSAKNF